MSSNQTAKDPIQISIEPLQEDDLAEADRIFRLAFGTFLNLPDPSQFHSQNRRQTGRDEFWIKLGEYRILWSFDSSSRLLGPGGG
jgi:hypothetical protein